MGSLGDVNEIAPEDHKGDIVASFYVVIYIGTALPAIGVGVIAQLVDPPTAIQVFAYVVIAMAILGRHTYDGFVAVWANRSGDPYTDHINAIEKYVVSTTLSDPGWANTTVIDHDPLDAIRELKQGAGANIVQYGFGALAHELMANGLLDELRLWLHPFFVGTTASDDLLHRAGSVAMFTHADTTTLANGIDVLTYFAAAGSTEAGA
jgi:dihydrofolate reductase